MITNEELTQTLDRLGEALMQGESVRGDVMARLERLPTPVRGRFCRIRRIGIIKPAIALAACVALFVVANTWDPGRNATEKNEVANKGGIPEIPVQITSSFSMLDLARVNTRWGFIDKTGKIVVEPKYTKVEDFSEGFAVVKVGGTHFIGGKYGFINRSGKEVIEPRFDKANSFSEGLATVQVDGKWGYINTAGEFRIQPRFEHAGSFRDGLATFVGNGKRGFIDRGGDVSIESPPSHGYFSEGLAGVSVKSASSEGTPQETLWGFMDKTGRIVIEPQFDYVYPFSEGLAAVTANRKSGYIDRDGKIVVPIEYNRVFSFKNGLAKVKTQEKGEQFGFIDKTGAMVIEPEYWYDHGVRYNKEDGSLTGLYWDPETNERVEAEFDPGREYNSEGFMKIWSGTEDGPVAGTMKYGFADLSGKVVIEPRFEDAGQFSEGLAQFGTGFNWAVIRRMSPVGF